MAGNTKNTNHSVKGCLALRWDDVLNFKGFSFEIILNLFHTDGHGRLHCITLCTPWGPTRLRDGIQYVTPVMIFLRVLLSVIPLALFY